MGADVPTLPTRYSEAMFASLARRAALCAPLGAVIKTFVFPHRLELAWDLDGTLIANSALSKGESGERADFIVPGGRYAIYVRPRAAAVLHLLSVGNAQHLFTAASQSYADAIVDACLPSQLFTQRLYRQSLVGSTHGKDLSRLGTPLERTLLIDDQTRNRVAGQHFLVVPHFIRGDAADTILLQVAAFVLLHNCIGPAAFDALHWLAPAPPAPRLLPPLPAPAVVSGEPRRL